MAFRNMNKQSESYRPPEVADMRSASHSAESNRLLLESLRSGNRSYLLEKVVVNIVENPVPCGFFLLFCESEHNAENLNFVVDVYRYRDFFVVDRGRWSKSWKEIDAELNEGSLSIDFCWPSTQVKLKAIQDNINEIWMKYIADTADLQICVSAKVLQNTKRRAERVDLYGPEVFGEALLDPISTLRRDTIPRFLYSEECADMVLHIETLNTIPHASTLIVPPPTKTTITRENYGFFNENSRFSLDELVTDKYLYSHFLVYLEKSVCSENLLVVRMIQIYAEMWAALASEPDMTTAIREHAWTIYRHFVASGSPYEVSLFSHYKRDIELALARPHENMFRQLEKSAYRSLGAVFEAYKTTSAYEQLYECLPDSVRNPHAKKSAKGWVRNLNKIFGLYFAGFCDCFGKSYR